MSSTIVAQNRELRKTAMAMVIRGHVSRNGKNGQCFINTHDALYLANSTACTCSDQPCAHTLAANLYNRARYTIETILERRPNISHTILSWIIEDDLAAGITDPGQADKHALCLAVCLQIHQEMLDANRKTPRFQSSYTVSLAGLNRADGVRMTRGF